MSRFLLCLFIMTEVTVFQVEREECNIPVTRLEYR